MPDASEFQTVGGGCNTKITGGKGSANTRNGQQVAVQGRFWV